MWKPLLLAIILLAASVNTAPGQTEIHSGVFSAGGAPAGHKGLDFISTLGQPISMNVSGPTQELASGFWYIAQLFDPVSSTAEDILPDPLRYTLHQNAPNPFNPVTTIQFELPRDVPSLQLRLFDIRGRHVATLHDGPAVAGPGSVTWRGMDAAGRAVASGVYFCVMNAPDFNSVMKMTVIR